MALGTLTGPLPKLGLGCWLFGNAPPGSDGEKTALEVVGTAYDAGVRHFDTAFDYGRGRSEEILGSALAGRPEAFIASKIQMTDPSSAVKGLEACLSRLGAAGEGVVVGDRHQAEPGLGRRRHQLPRAHHAIAGGGVSVRISHRVSGRDGNAGGEPP